jgi:molybdate transport system substrate-binding protein
MKLRLVAGLLLLVSLLGQAQEITVAAAADLNFALQDIAQRFEQQTGKHVKLSFGSSGNFFVLIQNGAPYDVFLSADMEYPRQLETAGLTEPGSLYQYAVGKIVLWAPNGSKVDVSRGLAVLTEPGVRKVAIANPRHAPYGRAAVAALKSAKVFESIANKLVFGENIAQAAQLAETGNADAGILALALVLAPSMKDKGRYSLIPDDAYPPLRQGCVILKSARDKATARQFLDFLRRPEMEEVLRQYGFQKPQ